MSYLDRTRRMLLDMHIPDWDESFLRRYDPTALARLYEVARVTAVMMYCKSQVGLANWPTDVGRQHPGLAGRDVVAELCEALRKRGIAACAYTSIGIDREAALTHPDWEVVPARAVDGVPVASMARRHSALCLNKPGYLAYEQAQLADLLGRYEFDACFLDMMFWSCVCVCEDCRSRFDAEVGGPLPERVDWSDPCWVAFAGARERWLDQFSQALLAHVRSQADVPVYQNFAPAFLGWQWGKGFRSYRGDSFLGGDLYGDRFQQMLACKTMLALSPERPPEFMTSCAPVLFDHASVKPEAEMTTQVLAATALSCAVMLIDAIDPDGTVDGAVYQQVGRAYARRAPFEPHLGGEHLEDVGVYLSSDALVRLTDDGTPLTELGFAPGFPHHDAAHGAIRALSQTHLAGGVATARQLEQLDRYPVLVVPDLTRVSEAELIAFDRYVRGGGRLYASGRCGLLASDRTATTKEAAEALFGVRFEGDEQGAEVFLEPATAMVAETIAPQRHLAWPITAGATVPPRIDVGPDVDVLATLTLPYAYPSPGSRLDRDWASVYSSPPWERTTQPLLVRRAYGAGTVVYSALPLETGDHAATALFQALLKDLLGERARLRAEAPASTWVEAFHQPRSSRFVLSVLDFPAEPSGAVSHANVRLRLPAGTRPAAARSVADGTAVPLRQLREGVVALEVVAAPMAMVAIDYRADQAGGSPSGNAVEPLRAMSQAGRGLPPVVSGVLAKEREID